MNRSSALTTGLFVSALLGLLDIAGLAGLFIDPGPPAAVAVAGTILGLITLAAVPPAWRGSRAATLAVITTRLLSALISAPVFVAADAPTWAQVVVGAAITATAIAVWLQAAALRRQPATAST